MSDYPPYRRNSKLYLKLFHGGRLDKFPSVIPLKTKSPRPTLRSDRDKSGDGSSPCSLSRAGIRRAFLGAASFPTLFSTASGVFGLVAGPSSVLRALNFE